MNRAKLYKLTVNVLFFYSVLLITNIGIAQVPNIQDCMGAIPVCNYEYFQPQVPTGMGNYPNEVNPDQNCPRSCMDGEENAIWYVISVKTSGLLRFSITPITPDDDYDWAVYNLNDLECSDIYDNAQLMQKSCNAAGGAGFHGTTGISTPNGGNANCNGGGPTDKWNSDLPVQAGDTYVVCVSNWTPTSSAGYTINFSASTADIFDDVNAYVTAIDTVRGCSGSASVSFDFNENVLCSSVQYNDFKIVGPDGKEYFPNGIYGAGCDAGGNQEKFYTLSNFYPPLTETGTYSLVMIGEIEDLCLNAAIAPPVDFYAEIDPLPTITDEPDNVIIPVGGTGTFHVEAEGTDTYRWQIKDGMWVNLTEAAPYSGTTTNTLTVTGATFDLGGKQYRCVVSGPCSPADQSDPATLYVGDALAASAHASPETICLRENAQLNVEAFGGSLNYTYLWSAPGGWTSTLSNPVVEPYVTTTYTVKVNDGYSPEITLTVTVVVNPLPEAVAGQDISIPHGTQTQLECEIPSTTQPYSYHWSPADSLWNSTIQNPLTIKLRGSCNFSVYVVDGNGCQGDPDMVTVNVIGGPLNVSPSANPDEICLGDTVHLSALASGGDTEKYTYTWYITDPEDEISNEPTLYVVPQQSTTYHILLDDGSNNLTRSVSVKVNPLPEIELIKPDYHVINGVIQLCAFDSITLDPGFINGEYLWSNGAGTFENNVATSGIVFDYQVHSVRVTDPITGCVNSDSVAVSFSFAECSYGFDEMALNDIIKLYPNPASNTVNLSIGGASGKFIIELTDIYGRLIRRETLSKNNEGLLNHIIDLTSICNGNYLLRVASIDGSIVRKLIIRH